MSGTVRRPLQKVDRGYCSPRECVGPFDVRLRDGALTGLPFSTPGVSSGEGGAVKVGALKGGELRGSEVEGREELIGRGEGREVWVMREYTGRAGICAKSSGVERARTLVVRTYVARRPNACRGTSK